MAAPNLADRLRAVAESLQPVSGIKADGPDLLKVKRIPFAGVAALEARASLKGEFSLSRMPAIAPRSIQASPTKDFDPTATHSPESTTPHSEARWFDSPQMQIKEEIDRSLSASPGEEGRSFGSTKS